MGFWGFGVLGFLLDVCKCVCVEGGGDTGIMDKIRHNESRWMI